MLQEFKKFALRGNVVDLAIGVIIGAAFGKIVASLVSDVLMPPLGLLIGGVDFSNLFVDLKGGTYASLDAAQKAGAPTLNYGMFIKAIIDFIIIAFVLFVVIRAMNRVKRATEEPAAPASPTTKDCPECLSAIPLKARRCAFCTATV